MGFYGNITNTNKTQFTFDRSYPNRAIMEERIAVDSIYLGRYVLVEYDLNTHDTLDTFLRAFYRKSGRNDEFFTSPNFEEETRIKWTDKPAVNNPYRGEGNAVVTGQIIYVEVPVTPEENIHDTQQIFYKCINSKDSSDVGDTAIFERVVNNEIPYTTNYNIDISRYGQGRGYDSTVWQKVYTNDTEKFVMIAELNSVVPTFDLSADAPTMEPITPHFDADSTNVYYKLHWQPQWGFRVARLADEPVGAISDANTIWLREIYDSATDKKIKQYFNIEQNAWIEYVDESEIQELAAAIYYNAAAFEKQLDVTRLDSDVETPIINKHNDTSNYFTVLPTGSSGYKYNTHDGTGEKRSAKDIQEMRINLPAIGNMMSDAWDIIHGPNRNDSTSESLQGRLDFFTDHIEGNEIPVQSAKGRYLVGTKINGNTQHPVETDTILEEALSTSYDEDDAWIQTSINVEHDYENPNYHQNAISIHHTFHPQTNTDTYADKNGDPLLEGQEAGENNNDSDVLTLYTPKVDAAGHVVGHNTEHIILPYGYKFFKTDGLNYLDNGDLYTEVNNSANGANTSSATADASDIAADNTKDTFTINPYNKWIQTQFGEDDQLLIAHEIHAIDTVKQSTNLNTNHVALSQIDGDNIILQDLEFDAAGHVIVNRKHEYTLPYGYKIIKVTNNEEVDEPETTVVEAGQIADNTQDTLTFSASNRWIKFDNSVEDTIQVGHRLGKFITTNGNVTTPNKLYGLEQDEDHTKSDVNRGDLDNDNTFEVPCFSFDEAGHITEARTHTVTLPELFNKVNVIGNSINTNDSTYTAGLIEADNLNDTVTLAPGNKWIELTAKPLEDTVGFSHYVKAFSETTGSIDYNNAGASNKNKQFQIQDITWDEAGHLVASKRTTYQLPDGFKTIVIKNDGNNNLGFAAANGGNLVADLVADTTTVNTGNRWIKLVANPETDSYTIYHSAASTATEDTLKTTQTGNETPNFGTTFLIPEVKYDSAGHISDIATHTVQLPLPSLNDLTATPSSVLTGIQMVDATGAITQTNADVGTLVLTQYDATGTSNTNKVIATDTINQAIKKLQIQIENEQTARANAISTLYGGENLETAFDTIKEIGNWLKTNDANTDGAIDNIVLLMSDETVNGSIKQQLKVETDARVAANNNLTQALNAETQARKNSDTTINNALAAEVSARKTLASNISATLAAHEAKPSFGITNENIEAWNKCEKNVQADWANEDTTSDAYILNKPDLSKIVETTSTFEYIDANGNTTYKTISELCAYIATLEARIKVLESPAVE